MPDSSRDAGQRVARIHDHFGHDVEAGPDCECGHPRPEHVGSETHGGLFDPPLSFFDGPCQVDGCACTPAGYMPGDGRPYAEVAPVYAPGWAP